MILKLCYGDTMCVAQWKTFAQWTFRRPVIAQAKDTTGQKEGDAASDQISDFKNKRRNLPVCPRGDALNIRRIITLPNHEYRKENSTYTYI